MSKKKKVCLTYPSIKENIKIEIKKNSRLNALKVIIDAFGD